MAPILGLSSFVCTDCARVAAARTAFPDYIVITEQIGKAMLAAVRRGYANECSRVMAIGIILAVMRLSDIPSWTKQAYRVSPVGFVKTSWLAAYYRRPRYC